MKLNWPQWVWLLASLGTLCVAYVRNGERRVVHVNLAKSAAAVAISGWLLWCGGFFG